MNWYYAIDGQLLGPVDDAEVQRLVGSGVIAGHTLVWRQGMPNWQVYSDVFGTEGLATPSSSIYQTSMESSGGSFGRVHFAGFWIRFVARLIDGILLGVIGVILRIPLFLMLGLQSSVGLNPILMWPLLSRYLVLTILINTAIAVLYEAYFVSTRGATPGKMALGIKIVMANGDTVAPSVAVGRYFAQWISGMILAIGYLMAAFDEQKRSLHDRICGTRVIYNR